MIHAYMKSHEIISYDHICEPININNQQQSTASIRIYPYNYTSSDPSCHDICSTFSEDHRNGGEDAAGRGGRQRLRGRGRHGEARRAPSRRAAERRKGAVPGRARKLGP